MTKLSDTVMGARVLGARIAQTQRQTNPDGRMPLMEHIRELRNRLLKATSAVLAGTAIGLIPQVYERLWGFVEHPFLQAERSDHTRLIVIGVFDPFMVRVQIALYFGLIGTRPGSTVVRGGGPMPSCSPRRRCSWPAPRWPTS
jgi:hypothetical protein